MWCSTVRAQPRGPVTGLDISLESLGEGHFGREFRARGAVYEVIGIAGLRPAPKARIRARLGGEWISVTADARGLFEFGINVPKKLYEKQLLELEVRKGRRSREYGFPVTLKSPARAVALTDRREYEPGDTVHFWSRVEDVETRRPLAGIPLEIDIGDENPRKAVTGDSGVAAIDFKLEKTGKSGPRSVYLRTQNKRLATASYKVGKRSTTDLLVTVETAPETAAPGEPVSVSVSVRTVRGTPARGATVSLNVSEQHFTGSADENGVTTFEVRAPVYSADKENTIKITGTAHRTGCRAADFKDSFQVRPKDLLEADLLIPRGGLVPETNERLIVSVRTADGLPSAPGTRIRIRGTAFKGKGKAATVDRYGLASVPIYLRPEDYAVHAAGDCASQFATTFEVSIDTPNAKPVTRCVPVLADALVAPFLKKSAVGPGDSFEVMLNRRPKAASLPVSVELLCKGAAGPLDAAVAGPASKTVRLVAPENVLGLCHVIARPMPDVNKFAALGPGASEPLLIRPDRLSFPTLKLDREQYAPKEKAILEIQSPAKAPKSWAAVAVRDLAQHQGEYPFDEYFMNNELKRAVLTPAASNADLLIRAALAAYASIDENAFEDEPNEPSGPAMEHDAARLARPLRNKTAGEWMVALERLLARALASGTIKEIAAGKGGRRHFRPEALDLALEEDGEDAAETLGLGKVTTNMLTALDPGFTFETAARRVARRRLFYLLSVLLDDIDSTETMNVEHSSLGGSFEPPERRLSDLVRRGVLSSTDLLDPWGNTFVLQKTGREPRFVLTADTAEYELFSPGPDGRAGTKDDVRDPWARAIPKGTLYARASGEDRLMARLSAVSPGSFVLDHIIEAYDRLTAEAVETLAGLRGYVQGGGSGVGCRESSGYGVGSGSGSLGGRRWRVSRVTTAAGMALAGMLRDGMLREDFPPTLYFKADVPLAASGRTLLEIPLAHAATTYLVEAILWREDGWRWSASAELSVDRDLLVDAPVPQVATVGDEIRLPVRLANRTDTDRTLRVEVSGSETLGISRAVLESVRVPADGTVEASVPLSFNKAGEGNVTAEAFDADGRPVDAVRRPISVTPSKRRARDEARAVLHGRGELILSIPKSGEPAGTNEITVTAGPDLFCRDDSDLWLRWLDGMTGRSPQKPDAPKHRNLRRFIKMKNPFELAATIGAEWSNSNIDDDAMKEVLEPFSDRVVKVKADKPSTVRNLSRLLMLLAPARFDLDARPNLKKPFSDFMNTLRVEVENGAALFADAPWLHARCAAALLWTAPQENGGARARELLERARSAVVTVGEDLWFEGGPEDATSPADDSFGAAAMLALAETRAGNRDNAFKLMRSLARLVRLDAHGSVDFKAVEAEDRTMVRAAAAVLGKGDAASELTVTVDGERHTVLLKNGEGVLEVPSLGRGGRHRIEVESAADDIILVRGVAEYTVDWTVIPPHVGPFSVRVDGDAGRLDERSGLRLVIRNRVPRAVANPVVELAIPAGAEVDEEARRRLSRFTVNAPEVTAKTLTLKLKPLRPQAEVVIPLPWLWTIAGRVSGLGTMSWAADRPQAITVSPSRQVEAAAKRAVRTGGTP